MVSVAQLVRVPDCDSGCRRFESDHSPFKKRSTSVGLFFVHKKIAYKNQPRSPILLSVGKPQDAKKNAVPANSVFKVKIQLFNSPLVKLINKS